MNPSFLSTALTEVAQSMVTMEPVLFFYGGLIAAAAVLWIIGVATFGRSGAALPVDQSTAPSPGQRITPAAL